MSTKQISIFRFDGGMAQSRSGRGVGECAVSKHFDVTALPFKLFPYQGVTADQSGQTGIGNIQIGTAVGAVFGLGIDGSGNGQIYKKTGRGDSWTTPSNGNAGAVVKFDFLIEHKGYWWFSKSAAGVLFRVKLADDASPTNTTTLSSGIPAGAVFSAALTHSKDNVAYFAYTTSSGAFVASTVDDAAFTVPAFSNMPTDFTPTCMSEYGNLLAIGGYIGPHSYVYLWDRDASTDTATDVIDWGEGKIKLLNQLDGVLIGISEFSNAAGDSALQYASVLIQAYNGVSTVLLKKITTLNYDGSTPAATINARVNFVFDHKLHFSMDIDGSINYRGVWTLAKANNRWVIAIEQMGDNADSGYSVLSAVRTLDIWYLVANANGTINATQTDTTPYDATAIHETVVNPGMSEGDYQAKKQLTAFKIRTEPLTSTGQVIVNYRVDSTGAWTTLFTKTATSPNTALTAYKIRGAFTEGYSYEFQLKVSGGAVVTGYDYEYEVKPEV